MGWKIVKQAAQVLYDWKSMELGEPKPEIVVVPETVPVTIPEEWGEPSEVPAEPARVPGFIPAEPQKVPASVRTAAEEPQVVSKEPVGYRAVNISFIDGNWKIKSPVQRDFVWEPGAVTAACRNNRGGGGHEAPAADGCHCGINAVWTEDQLYSGEASGVNGGKDKWITQIKAWGRVIPHDKGFRSQHAQIVSLRPPYCTRCEEPATHIARAGEHNPSGLPVCEQHGQNSPHLTPIEDVTKSLSDYYHVPVAWHGEPHENEDTPYSDVIKEGAVHADNAQDESHSPMPDGYSPRVDAAGERARQNGLKRQVDLEATKLKKNVEGLGEFAGFARTKHFKES